MNPLLDVKYSLMGTLATLQSAFFRNHKSDANMTSTAA